MVQILKRRQMGIDFAKFFDRNFTCGDFIEQESRPQTIRPQQTVDVGEYRRPIDGGERMVMLAVTRNRDLVVAERFEDPFDKRRRQQRHVATRHINDVGATAQRAQSGGQCLQRPPLRE